MSETGLTQAVSAFTKVPVVGRGLAYTANAGFHGWNNYQSSDGVNGWSGFLVDFCFWRGGKESVVLRMCGMADMRILRSLLYCILNRMILVEFRRHRLESLMEVRSVYGCFGGLRLGINWGKF